MTTRLLALDPQSADRLIKLLGMLGSAHAGERAVAGLKAAQLLRERGLSWRDLIRPPIEQADNDDELWRRQREFCLRYAAQLQPRELGFLLNISTWCGLLTERQQTWLDGICARLQQRGAAA